MTEPAFKDFDAVLAAKREKEGLGPKFKLGGVEFQCVITPMATDLADLVEAQTSGRIKPALDYLEGLIGDDQAEEFAALLRDRKVHIDMDTVQELLAWLAEQYSGRPTEPPSA